MICDISSEVEARKRSERAERDSAEQKRLVDILTTYLPGIFLLMDSNGDIVRSNERFEKITGRSAREIKGTFALQYFADSERQELEDALQKAFDEGYSTVEGSLISHNGQKISHLLTGVSFRYKGQKYVAGIGLDISKRVAYRQELSKNRRRLKRAQKLAKVGSWEWNLRLGERSWSDEAYRILGYDPGEVEPTKENLFRNVHPDDVSKITRNIEQMMDNQLTEGTVEYRIIPENGNYLKHAREKIQTIFDENGELIRVNGTVQDITEQKKNKKKMRRQSEVMTTSIDGMSLANADDELIYVNKAHADIYGYDHPDELVGKSWHILYDEDGLHELTETALPALQETGFWRGETVGKRKDGTLFPQEVSLSITGEGGIACVARDITERKKTEDKLEQSLSEKKAMLQEIHHRVKNNLAVISGMFQLQVFETENAQVKSVLNDSQLRIQSIALIHELLYEADSFANISLQKYIQKLIDAIQQTLPFDHQHINLRIEVEDISLEINQAIPCAILINELVTNAYKHAFNEMESGTITVSLSSNNQELTLGVRDDGQGLPADFSLHQPSSIGMQLIQTLTDQLDGALSYKTDSSSGTLFEICFDQASTTTTEKDNYLKTM